MIMNIRRNEREISSLLEYFSQRVPKYICSKANFTNYFAFCFVDITFVCL